MSVVANVAINVDSRGAVGQLKAVQSQAKITERAFDGINNSVSKLGIAFAGIQAAKFIFVKTAEIEKQTRSLEVLTGSATKAKQIIAELQQLGAVTPFTSTELIDAAKRLQAFGVEGNKVVQTTKRLADVSGATGAELQGLVTAYGQVQAKGRLQGEELLQFQERGIGLQAELQKMYGLSGQELQKALSKGQVSAEAVEVAIIRLTNAGGKYANGAIAQSDTLNGKFSTLIDNVETLAKQIGTVLSPTIKTMIDKLNNMARGVTTILDNMKTGFDNINKIKISTTPIDNWINSAKAKLAGFQAFIDSNPALKILYGYATGGVLGALNAVGQQNPPAANKAPAVATAKPQTPALLNPTASKDTSAVNRELDIKKQIKLTQDLERIESDYHAARMGQQAGLDQTNLKIQALSKDATAEKVRELNITKAQYEYSLKMLEIHKATEESLRRNLDTEDTRLRNAQGQAIRQNAQRELEKAGQEINNKLKQDELNAKLNMQKIDEKNLENLYKKLGLTSELLNLTSAMGQGAFGGMEVTGFRTDIDLLGQQEKALQAILEKYPQIGEAANAAANMATEGISAMIEGTKTAEQVFASFLKNIADMLLKTAQQMIAQYLAIAAAKALAGLFSGGSLGGAGGASNGSAFGGAAFGSGFDPGTSAAFGGMSIPGFAAGGTPPVGRPSLVGEQGPELFVPRTSGTIIPADTTAAMARYQRQSSAPGSAAGGAAGDTGASPASWAMNFETTQFLGQDWVSKDQLMAAMAATEKRATAAGAKAGAQQVATKMRTSPAFRRQVGV